MIIRVLEEIERLEDVTLLSEDGEGATGQGMLKRSLGSVRAAGAQPLGTLSAGP